MRPLLPAFLFLCLVADLRLLRRAEVFRFRNYDPETGTARKHARTEELDTVEKQVEGLTDEAIAADEAQRAQELDLTNIQPKKPNWDLKRDLERKVRVGFRLPSPSFSCLPPQGLCEDNVRRERLLTSYISAARQGEAKDRPRHFATYPFVSFPSSPALFSPLPSTSPFLALLTLHPN